MARVGTPLPKDNEAISVKPLSLDKIKAIMKNDPKFIGRLITQLDKQMHTIVLQKKERQEQIAADEKEIENINNIIASHVKPNLCRLVEDIKHKTELRDSVQAQLAAQKSNLKHMEREAAALIQNARTQSARLMKATASQRLEEARGFSSTISTRELIIASGKRPQTSTGPTRTSLVAQKA